MKLLFTNTFFWMIKNFDLLSIILATCLTWISRFDFSKSVTVIVRDQLAPEYFFPHNSIINDFPNGSLISALNKFRHHNILLIYSYSHWDAESVMYKDNIEKVAESMQYKIPIISINCWDNSSDCYDILRPNRYPQIFAYVSNSFFIEYKRSIEPLEIYNFISSLFYPFNFPKSLNDLEYLIKSKDASFITCLNSEHKTFTQNIRMFHKISSIYKGESNDKPSIAFIVISDNDSKFFEFRKSLNLTVGEAVLYSSSGLKNSFIGNFNVKDVLEFLKANSFSLINKYSPSGLKSLNIQNLLKRGYAVFYVYDESQKYLWNNIKSRYYFQSVAMRVAECSDDSLNSANFDLFSFQKEETISNYLNHHKDNLSCQIYFKSQIYSDYSFDVTRYLQVLDLNHSSQFSSYSPDPFVSHSLLLDINWLCRKQLLMKQYMNDDVSKLTENIKYLLLNSSQTSNSISCSKNFNRSITFAEIDGKKFSYFLEKWGLPSTDVLQPQIVVVDWKNEILHKMQSEITETSLNNLINLLFINNLTSHLKSNEYFFQDLLHPNFYPIDSIKLQQELNDPESDLVVFYYTPWCSYCSSIMHLLIMLGRYFKDYSNLHFTSLDTFNNDLPYKYQSERIPALVMFPRGRKSDSFVYPINDKSVTLSSMVRFVLENSGDINLNLNSPSINYNNEYNVTCDRICLDSTQISITHLLKSLRTAFQITKTKSAENRIKIEKICSFDDSNWLLLKAENSKDWLDYRIKQYYFRYQMQLIIDYHVILKKKYILHVKLLKLAKLYRAITHIQNKKSISKSVQILANEILNFST